MDPVVESLLCNDKIINIPVAITTHFQFTYILTMIVVGISHASMAQPSEVEFVNRQNITELKVGFITPQAGILGFETIASATTMAIDDAQADGYLPGINVT